MIGGHCIKAWESVVAKSPTKSELYSLVKGACEGLGLITLNKDLGEVMGVRLNLDATAAKGIFERQGIAKVRHIDVHALWLQQQVAKKLVPLIKVDGSDSCSDLMTKCSTPAVQQKHVEYTQLEFREGRAQKAAQLRSTQRAKPRGSSWKEESATGRRNEEDGQWVFIVRLRLHFSRPRGPG